ncbi:MAG TPA: polyhydroxyalkanoate depolymerase [Rhodopila sp.]|uniref:polyhydroxyalkanoate depolymerase n=1 Tax=Rhodopila sp. TaxID=2480087 RepID=UPI002BAA7FED|nr:polyhydroxyalkanoate depolymerase [Rhodopila sp.]HVY13668.1 polyhydroxyalkanoate depolymerase [Rhodopila sp.]
MMYSFYQAQADLLYPVRQAAKLGAGLCRIVDWGAATPAPLRAIGAALTLVAESGLTHRRPDYGFRTTGMGNDTVAVTEEIRFSTPFGNLLRFRKDTDVKQPRVLVVAPMSGHFATLLRGTVAVLLPDNDVYITDWKNARDIPLSEGRFGFDEYVDHVIRFLEIMGEGSHLIAVCQPAVAALAAAAVMAEQGNRAQPRSLTLMAGPIDTRQNPTRVNELAKSRSIEWFEKNLITAVPWRYKGAARRVYPGFLQLTAFMSMNLDRHINAHLAQFRALACGDMPAADAHRRFYGEYNAVMDLPAEFYLETVNRVFQTHDLPLGKLTWHGQKVKPEAIRRTALLTVEGERDDICAIGQTMAALDLCTGVRISQKRHHLQSGVGHYGVFSGSRWAREVYPKVRQMIEVTN